MAGAPSTWEQSLLLGIRTAGPHAMASHRTAAAVWQLDGSRRGIIEVLVPKGAGWREGSARLHETRHLLGADVARRGAVEVTAVERTIIDSARFAPEERLRELLDDAVRQRLTTYERVAGRLLEMPTRGRKGVPLLRDLLSDRVGHPVETKSAFETMMATALARSDLPDPVRQFRVEVGSARYYLDFAWPEYLVFVECDSVLAHSTPTQLEHDLTRQNDLLSVEWVPRRFTRRHLRRDPLGTIEQIRGALVRAGWRP